MACCGAAKAPLEAGAMQIDKIPVGDNPPESLNVIIEVPTGGEPAD